MTLVLQSFKVKLKEPKKKYNSKPKRQGGLVCGTVIEEKNDTFKVEIDLDKNGTKSKLLDFTPESFELVNRKSVFTREKDKRGLRTRIIRNEWDAKFHSGSTERYIPFTNNWIVKGYIVKDGAKELFEFIDLVGIKGYIISKDIYEEI